MDPLIVFDCERLVPNRFALVLAAAARIRALNRGAEPRLDVAATGHLDLALSEIAAGCFAPGEIEALLLPQPEDDRPETGSPSELGGGDDDFAAQTALDTRALN